MSHPQLKKRTIYKSNPVLQIDQKTLHLQGIENKPAKSVKSKEIQTPLFTPRLACKKSIIHRRIGSDYNNFPTTSSRSKGVQLATPAELHKISSATSLFTHKRTVSNLPAKEPRVIYIRTRKSSEVTFPKQRNYLGEPEIKFHKSSSEYFNDMWKYFEKKVSLKIGDGILKYKVNHLSRKTSCILEDLNISPVKQKHKKTIQGDKLDSRGALQTIVSPINATIDSSGMNDSLMSIIKELDRAL